MKTVCKIRQALLTGAVLLAALAVQPVVQAAAPAGKGVVVPPAGPQVDIKVARQHLRDNMQAQINEFMKLHNDARAEVGAPPLQWDAQLAAVAQKWADHLAAKGSDLEHSDSPYGENLAGYLPQFGERPVHGAKMWYDEIKKYHGEAIDDKNYMTFGHYTQMVWSKSTKVGFGVAMAPDGMAILCANYEVGGNMQGERPYGATAKPPADNAPAVPQPEAQPAPPAQPVQPVAAPPQPHDAPQVEESSGVGMELPGDWDDATDAKTGVISAISPDKLARVFLMSHESAQYDPIQEKMAGILKPLLPGLSDLQEVNTEHDVFKGGLALRVVTYNAKLGGKPVGIVVELARPTGDDKAGTHLLIRCADKSTAKHDKELAAISASLRRAGK